MVFKALTEVKRTSAKRSFDEISKNSDVDLLSDISSSEVDEPADKKLCTRVAENLIREDLPSFIKNIFSDLRKSEDPKFSSSVQIPSRVIKLWKGSSIIDNNHIDQIKISHNDTFNQELIPFINNSVSIYDVPDRIFSVKPSVWVRRSLHRFKENASICKKQILALVAIQNNLIEKESDLEKVFYETLYSSLNSSINLLTRAIKEVRSLALPPTISKQLKDQIYNAPMIGTSFWNFSSSVKKNLHDELKTKRKENFSKRHQFFRSRNFRNKKSFKKSRNDYSQKNSRKDSS